MADPAHTNETIVTMELGERLRFETLLSEISARFVNLPPDRMDNEINDAQRRICELLEIDRSTLWQIGEEFPGALLLTTALVSNSGRSGWFVGVLVLMGLSDLRHDALPVAAPNVVTVGRAYQ